MNSWKKIVSKIVFVCIIAFPIASECRTIAYSPSISGQPLIFHFNTRPISQFSAISWTQLQNALTIQSSYSKHLEDLSRRCCCHDWNLWADGIGEWLKQNKGHQDQFGFRSTTGGLSIGVDTCCNNFVIGAAASYTYSDLQWDESAGHSDINSFYGGLYSSYNNECFYINACFLEAYSDYETNRHSRFRGVDRKAHSHPSSLEILADIELGTILQNLFCSTDLIPFAHIDYVYLSQSNFSEHGTGNLLHLKSHHDQLLQSEIGLQLIRSFLCDFSSCNWTITPNLILSYINQTSLDRKSYQVNLVNRTTVFNVKGWNFNRNLAAVGVGLNFMTIDNGLRFTLYYDGQFGKNYWNQTASLMANLSF